MKLTKAEYLRLRNALRAGENYADLCAVDEDFRAKRALKQIIATVAWLDQKFMGRKTKRSNIPNIFN